MIIYTNSKKEYLLLPGLVQNKLPKVLYTQNKTHILTATTLVTQIRESPNIAETDAIADTGE
jgi:hypothetical protein